jgi:hypothetical protein
MGFDLEPRWKKQEWFYIGAFIWSWLLGEGVGLIIGTMNGMSPAEYTFIPRKGLDPHHNKGFRVTAEEAQMMAKATRALVAGYNSIESQWDNLSDREREEQYRNNEGLHSFKYKAPVREDFLESALKFADWAEKSGGFRIW